MLLKKLVKRVKLKTNVSQKHSLTIYYYILYWGVLFYFFFSFLSTVTSFFKSCLSIKPFLYKSLMYITSAKRVIIIANVNNAKSIFYHIPISADCFVRSENTIAI